MGTTDRVTVRVEGRATPLVSRAIEILRDRVQLRCQADVVVAEPKPTLILSIAGGLPSDAFRIDQVRGAVRVAGGAPRGLLYGVGKLLRTSRYDDGFVPSDWRGTSVPRGTLRGMYFASHFHNWYQEAPEPQVIRYMEDITLWGVNAVKIAFPFINLQGWDDPQADKAIAMARRYARAARDLGLQFCIGANNTSFRGTPSDLRAMPVADPLHRRGNSGNPVCPSNPDGHAYIMQNCRRLFEQLADVGLDVLMTWPYDEGGCGCDQCSPWGSNGHLRLSRDLTELARDYFPNLKTILSTWMFDTPPEGEWQGLSDALGNDPTGVDYILADSHEDYPRYPLDVEVPGNLPLLNFPEISMWGNWPWGGVGAHPLPTRLQRLWDQVKHTVEGGFPYSEGIYEDMNKAVVAQFYWDRDRSARETLREYIAYEFAPAVTEDVLALVDILEATASNAYQDQPVDAAEAQRANQLAKSVHDRLPEWAQRGWRWETLYLRTLLDSERFAGEGLATEAADAALMRLIEIYHCQLATDDPYHHRVRPPARRAVSRFAEC